MDLQSILGYSKGSPYANNPYLDINTPDGLIDMSNTDIDLWGIDNKGNKKKMKAGRKKLYQFPGDQVREIPIAQQGKLVNPFGDPRELARQNVASSTYVPINKQKPLAQQQLEKIQAEAAYLNQGTVPTAAQRATSVAKNKAYAAANPYAKVNKQGDLVPKQYDRSVAGTPDYGSRAADNDKAIGHAEGALEAASIVMPGARLVGKGLRTVGDYISGQIAKKSLQSLPKTYSSVINNNLNLEELRGVYHNSERILQNEEARFLHKHGYGLRENYRTIRNRRRANPTLRANNNQLPPPPDPPGTLYNEFGQPQPGYYDELKLKDDYLDKINGLPPRNYPHLTRRENIEVQQYLHGRGPYELGSNYVPFQGVSQNSSIPSSLIDAYSMEAQGISRNVPLNGFPPGTPEYHKLNDVIQRFRQSITNNRERFSNFDYTKPTTYRSTTKFTNKSGLTKEEVLEKVSVKDKDIISKMNEGEFENTVLKPNGEVATYKPGPEIDQMTYDLDNHRMVLKDQIPMTGKEYSDKFNEKLDLLNDIIAKRNKSGVEYRVKGLGEDGRLTFETPEQSITVNLTDKEKRNIEWFNRDPKDWLINKAGFRQEGNKWKVSDDGDDLVYDNIDDAIKEARKQIDQMVAPRKISGESVWSTNVNPGKWKGDVEDIANAEYYRSIPGIEMSNTTSGVFADRVPRKGTGAYESINEYLKMLDLGRVKPGFNSQTESSRGAWESFIKSNRAIGFYGNKKTVYGTMKSLAPYVVPTSIVGAGLSQKKQKGGPTREDIYKFLFDDDDEATAPDTNQVAPQPEPEQEQDETDTAVQIAQQDGFFKNNPYVNNPRLDRFPTSPKREDKGMWAYNYLIEQKGLAPHVAAGIVGNFDQESGRFRDDVIAGTKKGDSGLATGIAQWHPDRWKKAEQWANSTGNNIRTLKGQLDWAVHEASQRGDLQKVSKAKDTEEAAYLFAKHYERPKIIDNNRARFAKRYNPYKQGGIYQEIFKTNE